VNDFVKLLQMLLACRNIGKCSSNGIRFLALSIASLIPQFASASFIDRSFWLSRPILTNGQLQFLVWGETNIGCVIERSTDLSNWTPAATNSEGRSPWTNRLDAGEGSAFYRAVVPTPPNMAYAVAAVDYVTFYGTGEISDSFNSTDPNLSTDGQYDPAKASTNGHVADVQGSVSLGNRTVSGNLYLSPGAVLNSSNSQVLGTVYKNQDVRFPDVLPPDGIFLAAPIVSSTNKITVTGNYIVNNSLPIDVGASAAVTIMVTTPNFSLDLQTHGIGTNLSKVCMYLCGTNATIAGSTTADASPRARNLIIYGLPSLASVTLNAANFTGVVYAPQADISIGGSSIKRDYEGTLIVKSVTVFLTHFMFHFDEDLLNPGQSP
jgi:hypothetical protein